MVWTVSLVKSFHAREENLLPSRVPHLSRSSRAYFCLPEKCNKNFAYSRSKLDLISLHSLSRYSRPWITILFNLFSLFASESTESKCALRLETPSGSIKCFFLSALYSGSILYSLALHFPTRISAHIFFAFFLRSLLKKIQGSFGAFCVLWILPFCIIREKRWLSFTIFSLQGLSLVLFIYY